MSEEPIYCFNGKECVYTACKQYNTKIDTCNFSIIGLLGEPAPVAQTTQRTQQTTMTKEEINTAKLEPGKYVNIQGVLLDHPESKKGTRKDGSEWVNCAFRVSIDGVTARVTLWDELATKGMTYSQGGTIKFKGIQVKEPYNGTPQLNSSKFTEILD